ncbi:MAG: Class cytochrome family, partial [Deltaproteobacteria bacterium]|nr:Class cytochrome family [Deltaproteobacteria bacterium]
TEGKALSAKEAFHTQCKGCHQKEKKGPEKCDGCHKK